MQAKLHLVTAPNRTADVVRSLRRLDGVVDADAWSGLTHDVIVAIDVPDEKALNLLNQKAQQIPGILICTPGVRLHIPEKGERREIRS